MKYEADIDRTESNTSHNLMLELVGNDKRVLDVGCATGYLARALTAQGCTVSGVEIDPAAAEEARPVLKELVVGNLESLDLVAAFGAKTFDAVVFGDVLEHLTDPLAVLRGSLALLDDDGFIVISIPNVAHGSVRLALLKGKFEYRDLGLLDATHLRFFTRESFDALLRDAGLVPVEFRRTTADFFETEIPVTPSDFPPELLVALNSDPEGRTYQFVVKAVPVDSSPGLRRMYEENAAQKDEIRRLRRTVDALVGEVPPGAGAQVGLWGHFGLEDLRSSLLPKILRPELARRLPGATIRGFAPAYLPSRIDAGEPIEPLGPWDPARAEELAAELDAVVVTGVLGVPATGYPWVDSPERLIELDTVLYQGLGGDLEQSCPVLALGVVAADRSPAATERIATALRRHRYAAPADARLAGAGGEAAVPDPLFLVGRAFAPEVLQHRGGYLRLMGWYPPSGPVIVVQGDGELADAAPAVARVVNELAGARGARCVVVESKLLGDDAAFANSLVPHLQPPGDIMPIDAGLTDLLAAVANADAVIATSPSLLAVAFALGRPCVGLDLAELGLLHDVALAAGAPDAIAHKPTEVAAALAHAPTKEAFRTAQHRIEMQLDRHLDEVAAIVSLAAERRRESNAGPVASASLASRLAAVEAAHAALQQRMAAERLAFADRAESYQRQAEEELSRATTAREIAEARLAALYATKTMRILQPAHQFYGRLRTRNQQ